MDAENLIGQQIDRYRILVHIARGGMADVYLAEDVDLKRKVAFKVMLTALSTDPQFAARFQREAQIVAKLEHPNIVQVYRTGLMPSQAVGIQQPYLVMQYIAGGSLRDKLQELADREKLLKTGQALAIICQIAQALAVAHRANIVHRDLKPDNVLIRPDGTPVLVDLGIAAVGSDAKLTRTGLIMGTPHYMSPEQVRGKAVDGRSDDASLRFILYEGSDIFLDTGSYENGADISRIEDTRISFLVSGSCMSLQYDAKMSIMNVGCYEGACGYRAQERDEVIPLAEGYLLHYDILAQAVIETRLIRTSEGDAYKNILLQSEAGRTVHDYCVLPLFPESVATPITSATNTQVPTHTPIAPVTTTPPQPDVTNTPVPQPPTSVPPTTGASNDRFHQIPLPLLVIPTLWVGLGAVLVSSYSPKKSDELSEKQR